jgi:hypothetical protein
MKKEATPKCKELKNINLRQKKRQPQNARGSKTKASDEERGNPKMQVVQKERPPTKKKQPQNGRAQKQRPPMKKEATLKYKGHKKSRTIKSLKLAPLI